MAAPATAVSALRKAGNLDEALAMARSGFAQAPQDAFLQRAYGWVIYDLVKREVRLYEADEIPAGRLANRFSEWLADYERLDLIDRPGLLHSLLLTQILKGGRVWPGFLRFARWWDPTNLRDEDKQPYKNEDGRLLPNLEMRLLYAIGRTAVSQNDDPELREWAEGTLDQGLQQHPNDLWLNYYKSRLLIAHSWATEARDRLLPVVKRQQRASWVWSLLGQTFEDEDANKAITCYLHALQLTGQPSAVVNTRVRLAHLLAIAGRFPDAARQVRTALQVREKAGWKIPDDLVRLARTDWYRSLAKVKDLPPEPDVAEAAEVIPFGGEGREIETRLGIIDNQNPDKSLAHVAFSPTEGVVLHYKRFKLAADLSVGTFVQVGVAGDPPHPVRVMRSTERSILGFCEVKTGEFTQRPSQEFGFVITTRGERVFVPPAVLAANIRRLGEIVHCLAVLGEDKKRGALGWKALEVRPAQDLR